MKYLPSKKFILIVGSIGLLAAGWWFIAVRENSPIAGQKAKNEQKQQALHKLAEDSDGDGLMDWEEILWKTNIKNPDTDGDGTEDNAEILAGRSPVIPGPNDFLSMLKNSETAENSAGPVTKTQQLAQEFGASYLRRKLSGFTSEGLTSPAALSQTLFGDIQQELTRGASTPLPLVFSETDITNTTETSAATVKKYANTLAGILSSPPHITEKGPLEVINEAAAQDNTQLLRALSRHSENYKSFTNRMQTMQVPQALVPAHTAMMNNFWNLHLATAEFSQFSADAISGMTSFVYLAEASADSITSLGMLVDVIKDYDIAFGEEEPGTIFAYYAQFRK